MSKINISTLFIFLKIKELQMPMSNLDLLDFLVDFSERYNFAMSK